MDQDLHARYEQTVTTVNHEQLTQDIAAKQAELETLQAELNALVAYQAEANQTAG